MLIYDLVTFDSFLCSQQTSNPQNSFGSFYKIYPYKRVFHQRSRTNTSDRTKVFVIGITHYAIAGAETKSMEVLCRYIWWLKVTEINWQLGGKAMCVWGELGPIGILRINQASKAESLPTTSAWTDWINRTPQRQSGPTPVFLHLSLQHYKSYVDGPCRTELPTGVQRSPRG